MKLSPLLLSLALPLIPSVASAEILSVKTQSANFREQPSDKGGIVYSADKFYPVEVIERKNGWALVRDFEGDKAWVVERALAKQTTVVIQTDHANIREKASTDSEVLFKVEHGEVFRVEDRKDHWIKVVDVHGDGGWVRADMTWGIEGGEKPKADSEKLGSKSESKEPKAEGEKAKGEKAAPEKTVSEKSKADKPKAEEAKASSGKGDDEHCTCHKSDEEKAQKKVDLTERQTADKGEKSDKKKPDAKGESKAKTADEKSEHAKPGHNEHGKPESKGPEHHAKPEHDKAQTKPVHAKPESEHEKTEHDKPVHAKPPAHTDHVKPEPKAHAKPEPKKPS